jgi:hypothetical protein
MIKPLVTFGLTLLVGVASESRASDVDLQVLGGSCATSFDSGSGGTTDASGGRYASQFAGTEYGVAALVQPFRLMPFAIGGYALQQSYRGLQSDFKEQIQGLEAGADLMVWAPIPLVQPYVRGGYDLYGSHKYTATSSQPPLYAASGDPVPTQMELDGDVTGYHTAVGLRLHLVPMFGAFLQYDMAQEVFHPKRASFMQDGAGMTVDATDAPKITMASRAVEIGIDIGM